MLLPSMSKLYFFYIFFVLWLGLFIDRIDDSFKSVNFGLEKIFFHVPIHMLHYLFIHFVSGILLTELLFEERTSILMFV